MTHQSSAIQRRLAFTLVELLVVIAIIGVLVALLLPAVQAAREAARRTQCSNNLKQIGLGLHNYHDVLKTFPSGFVANSSSDGNGWGWGAFILPYIEQKSLYDALEVSKVKVPTTATTLTKTRIDAYRCPSDVGPDVNTHRGNHGTSNYAGVAGASSDGGVIDGTNNNGLFFRNSRIGMHSITDGTSNTLAVGERAYNSNPWNGAVWVGRSTGYANHLWVLWDNADHRLKGTYQWAFSSLHPGGVQFVLADGSVRFLSETIDGTTLRRLAQRNDGQVLGEF